MVTSIIASLLAFGFGASFSLFLMRKYFGASIDLESNLESTKSELRHLESQITRYKDAINTLQQEKDKFKAIACSHDIKIENRSTEKTTKLIWDNLQICLTKAQAIEFISEKISKLDQEAIYSFNCTFLYGPLNTWDQREYKTEFDLQCHASEITSSLENKLDFYIQKISKKLLDPNLEILDFYINLTQEIEAKPEPLPQVITVEVAVPDSKVIEIEKIVYLKEPSSQKTIDEDYVNALVEVALDQKLAQNKIKQNKVPQAQ